MWFNITGRAELSTIWFRNLIGEPRVGWLLRQRIELHQFRRASEGAAEDICRLDMTRDEEGAGSSPTMSWMVFCNVRMIASPRCPLVCATSILMLDPPVSRSLLDPRVALDGLACVFDCQVPVIQARELQFRGLADLLR